MMKKLKILFVSSGNSRAGITSLVLNQGNSLIEADVNVEYFAIKKKGILGYLKSIKPLRKHLRNNKYDLIHAHYTFSGMVCSLAMPRFPVVVSIMGSDVNNHWILKHIARLFVKCIWSKTIVKSFKLKKALRVEKIEVIPNGVDMEQFKPLDKKSCQEQLGWTETSKHLLFAADPKRKDKNFKLTEKAFKLLGASEYTLHVLGNVSNKKVPLLMNAADAVLLSSPAEGSPNVIKEAMACNCPIVSTDVGDVREIFGGIDGSYIAEANPISFSENIQKAISFGRKTVGRDRIYYLDSKTIAKKIVSLYNEILNK